jgi:hypothetical protein
MNINEWPPDLLTPNVDHIQGIQYDLQGISKGKSINMQLMMQPQSTPTVHCLLTK